MSGAVGGNKAVSLAEDVPDLIHQAAALDPALAAKWTGKALVASRTVWGTAAALVIAGLAKRYSLGWDQDLVNTLAGLFVLGVVAGLRAISEHPITGVWRKATPAEAAAAVRGAVERTI